MEPITSSKMEKLYLSDEKDDDDKRKITPVQTDTKLATDHDKDNNKDDNNNNTKNAKEDNHRVSPTCVVTAWEDDTVASTVIPIFTVATNGNGNGNDEIMENVRSSELVEALQKHVQSLEMRKERMQENLRTKRSTIHTLEADLARERAASKESRDAVQRLEADKESMRQGLVRLEAKRYNFKERWKTQMQTNKVLYEQLAVEQARGRQERAKRAKEQQLLELYRRLSHLTGYLSMGKEIRTLEAELAEMQDK